MKARALKKQEVRRQKRKELQQKRISGRHDWWSFLAERDLGRLMRGYMTIDEAIQQLRDAGYHIRRMDSGMLIGGSHVAVSSGISVVENSFHVRQKDGVFFLRVMADEEQPMTLLEAVARIKEVITPQPSITAPPRPPSSGPTLY